MLTSDQRARRMAEGREAFDRGDFFQAHELWEDVWRLLDGDERRWLQGLIQVAAARVHLARGRAAPAARLLALALDKLTGAPDELDGVAVATLRDQAAATLAGLRRGRAS